MWYLTRCLAKYLKRYLTKYLARYLIANTGLAVYFQLFSEHLDAVQGKLSAYIDYQTPLLYYWKLPIHVQRPQLQIPGLHPDLKLKEISKALNMWCLDTQGDVRHLRFLRTELALYKKALINKRFKIRSHLLLFHL